MRIDFFLTDKDLADLKLRYEVTSNVDFLKFITALANERRTRMRSDLMITNPASPLIAKLADVVSPTLSYIRHFASNRGWRKDPSYISDVNSKKAKKMHEKDLEERAVDITNTTEWFRSIKEGQILIGRFESVGKCKSVSSMLARWNHTEGIDHDLFISARYYWEVRIVVIRAMRRNKHE